MIETEYLVLGSMMNAPANSDVLAAAILELSKNDFSPANELDEVFEFLQRRYTKGLSIDFCDLVADNDFSTFSVRLGRCSYSISSFSSLPDFVHRLKSEAKLSALKNYYKECIGLCNTNKAAQDTLNGLLSVPSPSFIEDAVKNDKEFNVLLAEFMETYEKPFEQGQQTGIDGLDAILNRDGNGVKDGSLIVVMGGTKQGKTSLATTMFSNRADSDTYSLLFTMEISIDESVSNIIAQHALVHRGRVMRRDKSAQKELSLSTVPLSSKKIIIDDSQNMTIEHILLKSRMYARKKPIKTIMIDYLTLIKRPGSSSQVHEEWGEMVKSLRYLAKELNCIIIIVSQVTKAATQRPDPRPIMTDGRDTAQLQYDCHLMLGTFVDKERVEGEPPQMEVNIMLNRNGSAGDIAYFEFEGGNLKAKSKLEGESYNSVIDAQKPSYK